MAQPSDLPPPADATDEAAASADTLKHSAFSLPAGFRFRGFHGDTNLFGNGTFFDLAPGVAEASPVPAVDSAAAKTRLEVLKAWEVNFAILSLYVASSCALVYVLLALAHVRSVWEASSTVPPAGGFELAAAPVLRVASAVLPVLFALRVLAHGPPSHEQAWTGALLSVGLVCSNPLTLAAESRGEKGSAPYVALIVNDAVYTTATYLYLLLSAHSYRVLDARAVWRSVYHWKPAVVGLYFVVKLVAGFVGHVVLGLVPFARILSWFVLLRGGRLSARVAVPVLVTTGLDCVLTLWLFREVAVTARFLARTPYLEHRAKQLGFRCFVYQSMVFCVSIVALATVAILRLPPGILYRNFDDADENAFLQLETPSGHLGLAFVYFTWTVVLAYVNLPPGPLLPYTGHVLARYFQWIVLYVRRLWRRVRGLPAVSSSEEEERARDLENPMERDANAPDVGPLVPDNTIPLRYLHLERSIKSKDDRRTSASSAFSWGEAEANRVAFFERKEAKSVEQEMRELERVRKAEEKLQRILFPTPEKPDRTKIHREDAEDEFAVAGFLHFPQHLADDPQHTSEEEGEDDSGAESAHGDDFVPSYKSDPAKPSSDKISIPSRARPPSFPVHGLPEATTERLQIPRPSSPYKLPGEQRETEDARVRFEESTSPLPSSPPPVSKRLLLRKNLFVMETQVFLAHAAYLSYIPRNPREERVVVFDDVGGAAKAAGLHHAASLSCDMESMACLAQQRGISGETQSGVDSSPAPPRTIPTIQQQGLPLDDAHDPNRQPIFDDGTKFLIDPVALARKHGYVIYRQISNPVNNTHATILLGRDRVVVAFSGTRDARNWISNTKFRRCVFDDYFPAFECETQSAGFDEGQIEAGARYSTLIVPDLEAERTAGGSDKASKSARASKTHRMLSGMRKSASTDSLLHQSQHSWESSNDSAGDPGSPVHHRTPGPYGTFVRPNRNDPARESGRYRKTPSHRVHVMAARIAQEIKTLGQAKVHNGWTVAYRSLRRHVLGALVELYGGGTSSSSQSAVPPLAHGLPLFFTGHSLGGALATFGAYEAAKYHRQIGLTQRQDVACSTFGCPMTGNDAFKSRYERVVETHWRFELASDPVPKLPSGVLNYTHVGTRVLVDQSGALLVDPSFIEVHWWGQLANPYLGYKLHIRASYIMALRLYCELYKGGSEKLGHAFWLLPIKVQTKGVFLLPPR